VSAEIARKGAFQIVRKRISESLKFLVGMGHGFRAFRQVLIGDIEVRLCPSQGHIGFMKMAQNHADSNSQGGAAASK
jgi:hypothetical protein